MGSGTAQRRDQTCLCLWFLVDSKEHAGAISFMKHPVLRVRENFPLRIRNLGAGRGSTFNYIPDRQLPIWSYLTHLNSKELTSS